MVNALSFSRFLQLRDLLFKTKREELREKFILAAFVGFQMGAGGGDKTFSEYLEGLGLEETQAAAEATAEASATPEDKRMTAKAAIAKAEEILAMAAKKKDKA